MIDPQVAPEGIEQIAAELQSLISYFDVGDKPTRLQEQPIADDYRFIFNRTARVMREARAILLRLPRVEELQRKLDEAVAHGLELAARISFVCSRDIDNTEEAARAALVQRITELESRLPRVEGGRDIDQEPTKSVLRAEATEMTVNTAVPQPASGDSFTPAPDETVPWREGSPLCTNCGETAKPHPAYADFVGPFCDGCWDRLREYFTECPDCGRPLGGSFPKCIDCQLVDALKASE